LEEIKPKKPAEDSDTVPDVMQESESQNRLAQVKPKKPLEHMHSKPVEEETHEAPFRQGSEAHESTRDSQTGP